MKKTFLIFMSFALFTSQAQAVKFCGFEIGLSKEEKAAAIQTGAQTSTLKNITDAIQEQLVEIQQGCATTARVCSKGVLTSPIILTKMAWRVWKFEPSIEMLREHVFLPLADMLVKMKSKELTRSASDENKLNFVLFWPELILKVQKALPQMTVEMGFNAATQMIQVTTKEKGGALDTLRDEIKSIILKRFWANLKTIKTDEQGRPLSYAQRLQHSLNESLKFDADADILPHIERLKVELGIDKLQEALALYSDAELAQVDVNEK